MVGNCIYMCRYAYWVLSSTFLRAGHGVQQSSVLVNDRWELCAGEPIATGGLPPAAHITVQPHAEAARS